MTPTEAQALVARLRDGITPGPWEVPGQPDKVCAEGYTKNGTAKTIATVSTPAWMSATEPWANARLIAAAPELLDAIEALARALAEGPKVRALEWMHPCDDCWRAQGIERVYEIIALADGRFFLTNGPRLSEFPTFEAAKSAAEADHRARVLAQLEGQA